MNGALPSRRGAARSAAAALPVLAVSSAYHLRPSPLAIAPLSSNAPPPSHPRPASRRPPVTLPRPLADIHDERQVHAACVDSLYKSTGFGDRAKAIASEEKTFDGVLNGFKTLFDKHKTPESFKLAWPGIESHARDFLAAVDTYHDHLRSWLPRLVDALSPEQRAALVESMKAKRAQIAAAKIQGPDGIDMRALKKAAKVRTRARAHTHAHLRPARL